MSRIGKQPVIIPNGVTVEINGKTITVKGPKGELKQEFHALMKFEQKDNEILVVRPDETKQARSLHGLSRSLLANMVKGVSEGYEKILEIIGVGYRAESNGKKIKLSLGYSHPLEFIAPEGIEITVDGEKKNKILIKGIDKQAVGQVAAKIREFRKPEPYKGKGVKYENEYIARKAGKAAAAK